VPPWSEHGVPAGTSSVAQVWATHEAWAHEVPVEGQSLVVRQATHAPVPLQTLPPLSAHTVPAAVGAATQAPAAQAAMAHEVPVGAQSLV